MRFAAKHAMRDAIRYAALGLCLILAAGCSPAPPGGEPSGPIGQSALEQVSAQELPGFEDDLDTASLKYAIQQSLTFYERIPGDRTFPLGERRVRADLLKDTLLEFRRLMESNRLDRASIDRSFDVYRVKERGENVRSLVTGYYEPVLEGRLAPDKEFCYPIYSIPRDLVTVELSSFNQERFPGERLTGRLAGNKVIPYYTRAEIDGEGKLAKSGCQLAWLRDPVDVFFLQVQGSGMIRTPDGAHVRVGYAASNGRAYRSVGKLLLDRGVVSADEMSLQTIRAYLRDHPRERDEILNYNESYVFFRRAEGGPYGSLNAPLTAGRSIASDPKYSPGGALSFLETEKPRLDANGDVVGWEPLRRWVLNQDVGGAIKGMGRVDLFCGTGESAERIAGRLKHPGRLYFIVKREETGK